MRARAVWVIRHGGGDNEVIYSRRFGNVEGYARRSLCDDYVPVPHNDELLVKIVSALRLPSSKPLKYNDQRDSCGKFTLAPIYELCFKDCKLPLTVIVITDSNYIVCCLPLNNYRSRLLDDRNNQVQSPIPFGNTAIFLDLLRAISSLICNLSITYSNSNTFHDKIFPQLDDFLDAAMPLGRPIDTDPSVILNKMTADKTIPVPMKLRQPAWKPILHKGKQHITLFIKEYVRSVQYDRAEVPDVIDVYGSIYCAAALEGSTPEVSLTIAHDDTRQKLELQNLLYHPCLAAIDEHDADYYRVRFMPSNANFLLCSYVVPLTQNNSDMPICGVFKLRGDDKMVDFWLQLKLSNRIKNSFEYFEATIPFYNRGKITHAELKPSWGMTNVSQDRRSVIWSLGYKFPSKTLDASLKGTVMFYENNIDKNLKDQLDSLASFCVDLNCFTKINFITKVQVYSSCNVDSKSVRVTPETKYKFTLEKSFESVDCKIWNSYGDIPKLIQLGTAATGLC